MSIAPLGEAQHLPSISLLLVNIYWNLCMTKVNHAKLVFKQRLRVSEQRPHALVDGGGALQGLDRVLKTAAAPTLLRRHRLMQLGADLVRSIRH